MFSGIVTIPAITLGIVTNLDILDELVRGDVLVGEFGAFLTGSFEAVYLFVRDGTTVLASAFAVLGGSGSRFLPPVVPCIDRGIVRLVLGSPLMAERRLAAVQVPRCLRDVFYGPKSVSVRVV